MVCQLFVEFAKQFANVVVPSSLRSCPILLGSIQGRAECCRRFALLPNAAVVSIRWIKTFVCARGV